MIEEHCNKIIARAPFRLDLVMGGVSDLDWWKDRDGDCLSISCDLIGLSLDVIAEKTASSKLDFVGFGYSKNVYSISFDELKLENMQNYPNEIHLPVSAVMVALKLSSQKGYSNIIKGLRISHKPTKIKGMGGSSAIAACIISLVCYLTDKKQLKLNELVDAVVRTEKYVGIGGGWEDIAGIYKSNINWVKYRPKVGTSLFLTDIICSGNFLNMLSDMLLIVDSGIKASTASILNNAKKVFDNNFILVNKYTLKLQHECEIVANALINEDIEIIGKSLTRQRMYWNYITGGMSSSKMVDQMLKCVRDHIVGYREAGAGAGGMVLVMCKFGKADDVKSILLKQDINIKLWKVSNYGLQF